ncbi:MAG: ATP-binding protein, partial [Actinomycetota bacterium]|nr:ATP-binding protein [Actinomycetota bacterium]
MSEALDATNAPVLLGRGTEFAALRRGVEEAIAGRGSLFLITGEAGIGKSRLVEEASSWARSSGVQVVSGRCWEAVDAPPYWPWTQILRQLCAELTDSELRDCVAGASDIVSLAPQVAERLG